MKALLRGTDLVGLPVVTLGGEDISEVRDVLFEGGAGQLVGFTLNKRGMLKGRMKESLDHQQVSAIGPDAIMVPADIELAERPAGDRDRGGDVLADRVMTDSGVHVGTVTDVVIDTADGRVVGYEVLPSDEPDQRKGRRTYLPLPETGAVSGEALIVPASAIDYISTDLAGFGEAIVRYQDMLRGTS